MFGVHFAYVLLVAWSTSISSLLSLELDGCLACEPEPVVSEFAALPDCVSESWGGEETDEGLLMGSKVLGELPLGLVSSNRSNA